MFQSQVRSKLAFGPCSLLTSRLSEFGLIWAIHSISTLPFSHYKYSKWFCKVEIWIHHPQPMPHPGFWVVGWWRFWLKYPRFHTKMECVWIDSTSSQHLNPSNFSLWVWWIVGQGGCWYMCSIMVTTTCVSVTGEVKAGFWPLFTSYIKIEWVWTDLGNSQHLNPSILSL